MLQHTPTKNYRRKSTSISPLKVLLTSQTSITFLPFALNGVVIIRNTVTHKVCFLRRCWSLLWAHIPITINIERSLKAVTWPDHLLIIRPKGHPTRVGPIAHQSRTWCSSGPLPRPSVQFPLMHFNFLWHVTNYKTIVATHDAMHVTKHVTMTCDTSNKMTLPQQSYLVEAVHHHGN